MNPYWPTPADHITDPELITELLGPATGPDRPRRLSIVGHHLAHAASAFYPAGVADAAVIVVDGSGDGISTSIHHGTATGLRTVRAFPSRNRWAGSINSPPSMPGSAIGPMRAN
ncbi:hypothetical protein ACW9HR_32615 [Nocardia gipuzkoensis]